MNGQNVCIFWRNFNLIGSVLCVYGEVLRLLDGGCSRNYSKCLKFQPVSSLFISSLHSEECSTCYLKSKEHTRTDKTELNSYTNSIGEKRKKSTIEKSLRIQTHILKMKHLKRASISNF